MFDKKFVRDFKDNEKYDYLSHLDFAKKQARRLARRPSSQHTLNQYLQKISKSFGYTDYQEMKRKDERRKEQLEKWCRETQERIETQKPSPEKWYYLFTVHEDFSYSYYSIMSGYEFKEGKKQEIRIPRYVHPKWAELQIEMKHANGVINTQEEFDFWVTLLRGPAFLEYDKAVLLQTILEKPTQETSDWNVGDHWLK